MSWEDRKYRLRDTVSSPKGSLPAAAVWASLTQHEPRPARHRGTAASPWTWTWRAAQPCRTPSHGRPFLLRPLFLAGSQGPRTWHSQRPIPRPRGLHHASRHLCSSVHPTAVVVTEYLSRCGLSFHSSRAISGGTAGLVCVSNFLKNFSKLIVSFYKASGRSTSSVFGVVTVSSLAVLGGICV